MNPFLEQAGFFYCKRFRCHMLKIRCVQRQNKTHAGLGNPEGINAFLAFPECRKCEQGWIIRAELALAGAQRKEGPSFAPDLPSLPLTLMGQHFSVPTERTP
jgi:hypothetical protein